MHNLSEETSSAGSLPRGSSWMQITFTLDTEYYQKLWAYAEARRSGVPGVVRENIIRFLSEIETRAKENGSAIKENAGS